MKFVRGHLQFCVMTRWSLSTLGSFLARDEGRYRALLLNSLSINCCIVNDRAKAGVTVSGVEFAFPFKIASGDLVFHASDPALQVFVLASQALGRAAG